MYLPSSQFSQGRPRFSSLRATVSGTISPSSSLTPQVGYGQMVADASGHLYLAGAGTNEGSVYVYSAGASGSASPTRTILGNSTSFLEDGLLAVDTSGQLYVLDPYSGSISVFSASANGSATPLRRIAGSLTQLPTNSATTLFAAAFAVDASGNIYVALTPVTFPISTWTILVFSSTQTGNATPTRVITATSPAGFAALPLSALDANGNFYVGGLEVGTVDFSIMEFAVNASAVATPVKTIAGSATGLLPGAVFNLCVDGAGNIYTISNGLSGATVEAFGASGSGNLVPAVTFTSTSLPPLGTGVGLALR